MFRDASKAYTLYNTPIDHYTPIVGHRWNTDKCIFESYTERSLQIVR